MNSATIRHVRWFMCVGALMAFGVGCGKKERTVFPVTGQVVMGNDKKPAAGVMVFFNPDYKLEAGELCRPVGTVDQNGKFSLMTRRTNDGAPAGDYVITLTWPQETKSVFEGDGGGDKLKGEYSDVKKSKLHFKVQAGPNNEVPAIELP